MVDITIPLWLYPVLAWTLVWKAIGAWKAAKKDHVIWFVAFFIFNTLGILPILYLLFFQNMVPYKKIKKVSVKKVVRKKSSK